jgi:hypothetical protein
MRLTVKKSLAPYALIYLLLCILHLLHLHELFDDTYIHLRIAENFVNLGTPYYNPGEPYLSSSASLWTILVAAAHLLFRQYYTTALALMNPLFMLLTIVFFKKIIACELRRPLKTSETLILTLTTISILLPASTGLMETPLALLLSAAALYLFTKKNLLAFALLSLAVFLRLELAILWLLFFAYHLLYFREKAIGAFFVSMGASVPLIAYCLYFFNTIIPLTLKAKTVVYDIDWFDTAYMLFASFALEGSTGNALSLAFILALIIYLLKKHPSKLLLVSHEIRLFGLFGLLLMLAYTLQRVFLFDWYMPLYALPVAIYMLTLQFKIQKKTLAFMLIASLLPFYMGTLNTIHSLYTKNMSKVSARVLQYLEVSKKLYLMYPDEALMTSEIGALGYGFKGKILDGVGLINPDSLKYHPMPIPKERMSGTVGAIPTGYIEEKMPGIIVSYDTFISHFKKQPIAKEKYNLYKLPNFRPEHMKQHKNFLLWGSKNLNLYIRKDIDKGEFHL